LQTFTIEYENSYTWRETVLTQTDIIKIINQSGDMGLVPQKDELILSGELYTDKK